MRSYAGLVTRATVVGLRRFNRKRSDPAGRVIEDAYEWCDSNGRTLLHGSTRGAWVDGDPLGCESEEVALERVVVRLESRPPRIEDARIEGGVKDDGLTDGRGSGLKARWDLLPMGPMIDVVDILTTGATKYAPNNWQKVPGGRDRYFAAAMRHLAAWRTGERDDPETGKSHLAHAMCCLLFLAWFDKFEKENGL